MAVRIAQKVKKQKFINIGSAYGYLMSHWTPWAPPIGEFSPNSAG